MTDLSAPPRSGSISAPSGPRSVAPGLAGLRAARDHGPLGAKTHLAPGLSFHADPGLAPAGHWSSPADRIVELSLETGGTGSWAALHVALDLPELGALSGARFLALMCRSAAGTEIMVRPCLRSGLQEGGFTDLFFPRHLLAVAEPRTHTDAFWLPALLPGDAPDTAPWRELVLFLPPQSLSWHVHALDVVLA
ncbi:hypothetical protein [Chachezhania sediminis]|uniref:hypothetical protein n=1 Tax=Chachezhania sediminis TaxID=2599291 RepID=UPI00131C2DA8|nr:hypothetical protein [Chachezhania sediminis]